MRSCPDSSRRPEEVIPAMSLHGFTNIRRGSDHRRRILNSRALLSWIWMLRQRLWVEGLGSPGPERPRAILLYLAHGPLRSRGGDSGCRGGGGRRFRAAGALSVGSGRVRLCKIPARNRGGYATWGWRPWVAHGRMEGVACGSSPMSCPTPWGLAAVYAAHLELRSGSGSWCAAAAPDRGRDRAAMVIKHDGSRASPRFSSPSALLNITALLGLVTLWLACGTLARDIEDASMQLVCTAIPAVADLDGEVAGHLDPDAVFWPSPAPPLYVPACSGKPAGLPEPSSRSCGREVPGRQGAAGPISDYTKRRRLTQKRLRGGILQRSWIRNSSASSSTKR